MATNNEPDDNLIKIRVIDNGVIVRAGQGWLSYPSMDAAWPHIKARVEKLIAVRQK